MLIKEENGFEKIIISDNLDKVIENTIKRAKLDKKYKIKFNLNECYMNC
ncbi:MAG: hypothetical protein ACREVX_04265 [Clostridium sp.]